MEVRVVYGLDQMWYPVWGFPRYKVNLVGQVVNLRTGRVMKASGPGVFGSVYLVNEDGDRFHCSVFKLMRESIDEWRDGDMECQVIRDR
jgi:hypothetical protein